MIAGLRASSCPLLTRGSIAWNVKAVVARPSSPASNFMVGTQRPKSRDELVDATKPPKLPVTALVTAPKPTLGEVQRSVEPLPVQVPAVPEPELEEVVEVDVDVEALVVVSAAAAVASADAVEEVAARVTVTKVVPPQTKAALVEATWAATVALVDWTTDAIATDEVSGVAPVLADVPRAEAGSLVPSSATAVKLENP